MADEPSIIEYRVRPLTRYVVTRFEGYGEGHVGACSAQHGEFDNFETAYAVGYALAKAEHDRLGWPIDDERIQYPRSEGASGMNRVAPSASG